MAEQVRVGVIGTSWYADMMHLPILAHYKRAALTAICGRNREQADEMAAKYGVPQVFTDHREMIEKGGLDAVVVSTPDDTHYDMVMAALDAGLHVICEKPVALNADRARQMLDKAEAAGVKHMVYHTFRWFPNYRYVKQLLDEGYVGRPYHGSFRYVAGYGRSSKYLWRFDGDRAHGVLGDLGSHCIDLARWYMGDIESVSAVLNTIYQRQTDDGQSVTPVNDFAMLNVVFANGAAASIQVSAVAHVAERNQEQSIALHGENGTLETQFWLGQPHYTVRGASSQDDAFGDLTIPQTFLSGVSDDNPLIGMFFEQAIGARLFVDCILDDQMPEPNLLDGYKTQQVIDAAIESHNTGRRVAIG